MITATAAAGPVPRRRIQAAFAAAIAMFSMTLTSVVQAAQGDALGPPITVFAEASPSQRQPSVGRAADGTTVVVWIDSFGEQLRDRRFAADGSPLDAGFVIAVPASGMRLTAPDVAVEADGDFAVAWLESDSGFAVVGSVRLRRYTADGAAAGAAIDVRSLSGVTASTTERQGQGRPAVAVDNDGDVVVAFLESRVAINRNLDLSLGLLNTELEVRVADNRVVARRYRPDGSEVGVPIIAGQRADFLLRFEEFPLPISSPVIAAGIDNALRFEVDVAADADADADADGDFALTWAGDASLLVGAIVLPVPTGGVLLGAYADPVATTVFLRRYDRNGLALSRRPVRVDDSLGSGFGRFADGAQVALDATGDPVVAWRGLTPGLLRAPRRADLRPPLRQRRRCTRRRDRCRSGQPVPGLRARWRFRRQLRADLADRGIGFVDGAGAAPLRCRRRGAR